MDKPKNQQLPSQQELWEYYFNGLLRNINSILAGVSSDYVGIGSTNSTRGEKSDSVLAYFMKNRGFSDVIHYLFDSSSHHKKQHRATLHDLALAHALICTAQQITFGSVVRSSRIISSSMVLGRVIPEIRRCYLRFAEAYPGKLVGEVPEEALAIKLAPDISNLATFVQELIQGEKRSTHLRDLQSQFQSPRYLLGLFSYLVSQGLDDRSFEEFLRS